MKHYDLSASHLPMGSVRPRTGSFIGVIVRPIVARISLLVRVFVVSKFVIIPRFKNTVR